MASGGRGTQFEQGTKVEYEALPDDEEGCYANFAYDAGDNFDGFSSGSDLEEAEVEVTGTVDDAASKTTAPAATEEDFGGFDDTPAPAPAPRKVVEPEAPAPPPRQAQPTPPKAGRSSVMSLEGAGSMKKRNGDRRNYPGLEQGRRGASRRQFGYYVGPQPEQNGQV